MASRSLRVRNPNVDYTCKNDLESDIYSKTSAASSTSSLSSLSVLSASNSPASPKAKAKPKKKPSADQNEQAPSTPKQKKVATKAVKKVDEDAMDVDSETVTKPKIKKRILVDDSDAVSEASAVPIKAVKTSKSDNAHVDAVKAPKVEPATVAQQHKRKAVSKPQAEDGTTTSVQHPVQDMVSRPAKAAKTSQSAGVGTLVDSTKKLLETFKQEHSLSDLLAAKDKQYEELLAKVNAMKEHQEREQAKLLDDSKKDLKEKEKAASDIIAHLKREVERLKKRLDGTEDTARREQEAKDLEKIVKENEFLKSETIALYDKATVTNKKLDEAEIANEELQMSNDELKAQVEALQKELQVSKQQSKNEASEVESPASIAVIEAYQALTRTRVTPNADGTLHCKMVNSKDSRVLEFDITITDTDVEYVPTRVDLHGLVAPDYITDSIGFDVDQAPVFMKNVLATVFASQ